VLFCAAEAIGVTKIQVNLQAAGALLLEPVGEAYITPTTNPLSAFQALNIGPSCQ